MMDKLTQKSQEALKAAQELARERSHQELDGAHLALALTRQTDTIVPTLLQRVGSGLGIMGIGFEHGTGSPRASGGREFERCVSEP